jgi:hypothetical protein
MNTSGSSRSIWSKSNALNSPCRHRKVACVFTRMFFIPRLSVITSLIAARRRLDRRDQGKSRMRPGRTSLASSYMMSPTLKSVTGSPCWPAKSATRRR